jgi:FAD/FMN-containing dehydrogenase
MDSPRLPPGFAKRMASDFPADLLSEDPATLATFGIDWTTVYTPNACAVAQPRSTDEVARLLTLANQFHVAVVPSGGRTGLAGGAVAAHGELVLSLSRMHRMDPVDVLGESVRVQAGAVTEAVHQHCAPFGLTWPVDFASKGSSQVGGNIATNAGGVRVIRYGLTRNWVLGLEVVTAQGEVLELNGALEKNNTGLDLRQLFIGSEGTLGVITEATLKLTHLPAKRDVMLFGLSDLAAVLRLFGAARGGPFTIAAYEFFSDRCLARVLRHRQLQAPLSASANAYVLLEVEHALEPELDAWLSAVFEQQLVEDGVAAQSSAQAGSLWALREGISESLSSTGLPHKNDVALPVARLARFCDELERVFAKSYPGWEIALFGHVGDGNLHINVMKPEAMEVEEFRRRTKEADHDIFTLVRKHGGSISAEHGIGLLKKDYLGYTRTPGELVLLKAVKRLLDPQGILNPGKVFDL